ncbi:MAG: 6,7-dimethyl-8-ribityllumazine synthase [Bacteroidales bacterium]|jgi:6,7-dimethyl-8-ribityllumazine synthase|nr:6,7-dimethyl-8-ribityllumazine synthase [Bacteroidales bacterium]MBP7037466.1 6,7-dimethyl-8-ribityllumazine synthase [Bacteroidales bacterium]MDI9552208.1 6,7-dimethyl-8-ribityllumazine synthase [Bacteroidota bacterium]
MSTADLSDYDQGSVPDAGKMTFGIVVSDWNHDITSSLLNGALNTLKKHGAKNKNIIVRHVPGSFELTIGAQLLAESYDVDAIICLGCVIQGETPHFTYICQSVTYGITKLNLDYGIPFIFGVLTTLNHDQALERSGGKHGNKGDEAAVTAIKMVALDREM